MCCNGWAAFVAQLQSTRSAQAIGEAAVGVSASEFRTLEAQGAFALSWHANGLGYGIPIQIDPWLAAGRHVLVNGSRGHLKQALQRYPTLIPILLTVEHEVLRQRLVARGRETAEQIDQRLARNQQFAVGSDLDAGVTLYRLDNSASLSATVARLPASARTGAVSAGAGSGRAGCVGRSSARPASAEVTGEAAW